MGVFHVFSFAQIVPNCAKHHVYHPKIIRARVSKNVLKISEI